MNNLWHTNFKADQDGVATFRYFIQAHEQGYNSLKANQQGLNNHQPLIVAAATANEQGLPFKITGNNIYTEILKPADDGKGTIVMIVNTSDAESIVNVTPQQTTGIKLWDSNLAEDKRTTLDNTFTIPGKGIKTIRIETK